MYFYGSTCTTFAPVLLSVVHYTGRDGRKTCHPQAYSCHFVDPTVQYDEIGFRSLLFDVRNSGMSTADLQQDFHALKADTDAS
jgi:hypothetical protein